MKKTILSITVLFIASIFFTSCSQEKNMIIEKRHYGKGYYIHRSGQRDKLAATISENTNSSNKLAVVEVPENKSLPAVNHPVQEAVVKNQNKPAVVAPQKQNAFANQANNNKVKEQIHRDSKVTNEKAQTIKKQEPAAKAKDDVSDILLIILCFILPPLAVFLHEGGLTIKFWLDLLLCLFFWLPGIIYALIVCFF
ncbi:hypothetical protein BH09BAC5_BH09BAC5_08550 [soil metagenome]